ncbi:MAG: radical SAM protein [Gemmatimonadaceae bacterium]|nr:radical SAM protein [Acetobacteraceae bacterium]
MSPAEIAAARPYDLPLPGETPLDRARARMQSTGQWTASQTMGRRWPIGCVALEITQRCNLDCTLCYLSEQSEAVHDTPLPEIFRRIDAIAAHYGPNTDVQVTGGDPTLRARAELVAIVRRIRERGLRPSLFTNGIRATRGLLTELCDAGLVDVAFHVDTTQQRRGVVTEADLHPIRTEYIARARGLPLSVFFNTTVHAGNFAQIPDLVRFFVRHSDIVRLASFQLQADTGRGVDRDRADVISKESVARQVAAGAGAPIAFDTPGVGHQACNRYAMTLVANGRVHDLFDDKPLMTRLLIATQHLQFDRTSRTRALRTLTAWMARHPIEALRAAPWAGRKLWAMRADLIAGRGRVQKLSFFIHDFMGATVLDRERIDACVFMAATADGPVSMCLHNARRDSFILAPMRIGGTVWDPLTGTAGPGARPVRRIPLKGRQRA